MANAKSLFSGNLIQSGDNLRMGSTNTALDSAFTDVTLLNVASGGGMFHSIIFSSNNASSLELETIKVTVDGAAERTLFDDSTRRMQIFYNAGANGRAGAVYEMGLPIPFDTSITVKVSGIGVTGDTVATTVYSVNP